MRAVPEWVGKTDDSEPPPHVRLRVFEKHNRTCHWSKRKIRPGDLWDVDHVRAIANGGENRESNLAPILRGKPHKEKTKQDMAEKSKVYARKSKHVGLKKKKKYPWACGKDTPFKKKFSGDVVRR